MTQTAMVWVYMYVRRIVFIASNNIRPQDLAAPYALARLSTAAVSKILRTTRRACSKIRCSFTRSLSTASSPVRWMQRTCVRHVAFRALHSAVHCTFNLVMLRFHLYLIATLAAWFMVVRAALTYLGG